MGSRWFTGDVLCPGMDAYLADGHYQACLASIDRLREAPADAVCYAGHGAPAGRDGIAAQRAYIETFVDAVRSSLGLGADQRRGQVLARVRPLVSDRRLQFLMELSIEPVAAALRAAGTPATVA